MSSKFKDLMAQARSRQDQDAQSSDESSAQESQSSSDVDAALEPAESIQAVPLEEGAREGGAKRRGRPPGKRSHPDFEQVSAYISKSTHRNVKIALLHEGQGRQFSELVEELLANWLEEK